MKRLLNFLLGTLALTVCGPFPERLLNLCAQARIAFWAVEWPNEHTLRLTVRRSALKQLTELAERVDCSVRVEGRRGLPDFLIRFRRRYAFLIGLTLSLCAAAVLSRFVMTVEVTGNEKIPTAVILSQLRQYGVCPGVYGPSIDRTQVAQEVRLALPEIAWMGINLHGTRLEVIVREVIPQPERIDETGWYDVVAESDGIITHVEAELGDALVAEGDTVLAGEVLISGTVTMEPPQYSDQPPRYYQTHARGRVWARTWRTLTAAIPLEAEVKGYTGDMEDRWSLELFGRPFTLWGEAPSGDWESGRTTHAIALPGGFVLPVRLVRERSAAYERKRVTVDPAAAQNLLEEHLRQRLEALLGEDGTAEKQEVSARVESGVLRVTLHAECLEEIGTERPGTPLG